MQSMDFGWIRVGALSAAVLVGFIVACASVDDWHEGDENPVAIHQGLAGFTFELQQNPQGLGGTGAYSGATDATIYAANATTNYGASATCTVDGGADERSCVFRWEMPPPNNAIVTAASIILTLSNGTNSTFNVYKLLKSWDEAQVTWNNRTTSDSWTLPGAKKVTGAAADRDPTILGTLTGSAGQNTITLNASGIAAVQSWMANSNVNFGVIIAGSSTDGVNIRSSEYATITERPILRVTYHL